MKKEKSMKYIRFKIGYLGAPLVDGNRAWVEKEYPDILAVIIPMKSKWCKIGATTGDSDGSIGLVVDATPSSLHLKPKTKRSEPTYIDFPKKYKNWDIFSYYSGKYDLYICLTRNIKKD